MSQRIIAAAERRLSGSEEYHDANILIRHIEEDIEYFDVTYEVALASGAYIAPDGREVEIPCTAEPCTAEQFREILDRERTRAYCARKKLLEQEIRRIQRLIS